MGWKPLVILSTIQSLLMSYTSSPPPPQKKEKIQVILWVGLGNVDRMAGPGIQERGY